MKQKFFRIPVADSAVAEAELNSFCDQQSVSHLERHLVMDGQHSFWAICVTWSGNTNSPVGKAKAGSGKRKIDYKDELSDDDFMMYSRLRELRKTVAEREGVAVYNVFNNEQLAAIVQQRISSKNALTGIAGIGQKRIDKYGDEFLDCLRLVLTGDGSEANDDNA